MVNPTQRTVLASNPYLEIRNVEKNQKCTFNLTHNEHKLGRDKNWADMVVPQDWMIISSCHAIFQKQGNDYIIIDGNGNKHSTNRIYHNYILINPGYPLQNNIELQVGQNPNNWILIKYINPAVSQNTVTPFQKSVSLSNGAVEIGRDMQGNNTLKLESATISRRHARIEKDNRNNYILHDYSTNGIWVNGQKVTGSTILTQLANIQIGPYTLVLEGDNLKIKDQGDNLRLDTDNLYLKGRVDHITLTIQPGQFVALVGGSGAGKSSLMKTLLGIEKPQEGLVYLNGLDLRKNFNIYRNQIGYVPQDDILHPELTVEEVITYAAKMRLSNDIKGTELRAKVEEILVQVDMTHKKNALVKSLSGGQRKRVSIGVELLANPKLFFLDEPTSGLDPGLDKKMMQLLRTLANQGRTVILVTHATANINECDRIAFLGRGGRLCYFGTPGDAFKFFNITSDDFADIYVNLETDTDQKTIELVTNWRDRFKMSPFYQIYIQNLLKLGQPNQNKPPQPAQVSPIQQLILLTQRYLQLVLRDKINLGISLITAPFGVILAWLATGKADPFLKASEDDPSSASLAMKVLLIFSCAGIWVGISSAAQEIVKEGAIYLRERLVNLNLFSYLTSKLLVLGGLAVCQTVLMVAVILWGFKPPVNDLFSWQIGVGITSFLTIFSSMSLGLLISSLVSNSSQASSLLPLIMLPLITFSGVLFDVKKGIMRYISWSMISRWSVGSYGILVDFNSLIPKPLEIPGKDPLKFLDPSTVYDAVLSNLYLNWGVLLLYSVVCLIITFIMQKRKDIL